MTERTVGTVPVDPVAFVGALILAPLAVAACTFWLLLIPVVGIFFGAPFYLTVGAIAFALSIVHGRETPSDFAVVGLATAFVSVPVAHSAITAFGFVEIPIGLLPYTVLGMIHGTAWGWAFGRLYRAFRDPLFAPRT